MSKLFNGIFEKYVDVEEQWKDIYFYDNNREKMFDYRGRYEVSTYGKVRNKKTGKLKKQEVNSGGYLEVQLYDNGYVFLVHRLVAYMFIPNPKNKPFVDHFDNNKQNNHIDNLSWCTARENNANPITKKRRKETIERKRRMREKNN